MFLYFIDTALFKHLKDTEQKVVRKIKKNCLRLAPIRINSKIGQKYHKTKT